MNDLFEDYGWVIVSLVGGYIGIDILSSVLFGTSSAFSTVFYNILGGLM